MEPISPVRALDDDWHPVMHVGHVDARLGRHHRVDQSPFWAVAPQAGHSEDVGVGQRKPGARLIIR